MYVFTVWRKLVSILQFPTLVSETQGGRLRCLPDFADRIAADYTQRVCESGFRDRCFRELVVNGSDREFCFEWDDATWSISVQHLRACNNGQPNGWLAMCYVTIDLEMGHSVIIVPGLPIACA